jgi:hypothetical protein
VSATSRDEYRGAAEEGSCQAITSEPTRATRREEKDIFSEEVLSTTIRNWNGSPFEELTTTGGERSNSNESVVIDFFARKISTSTISPKLEESHLVLRAKAESRKESGLSESDWTLFTAACGNDAGLLMCLLDLGVNPNVKDKGGDTALHWACTVGSLRNIKVLLHYGAVVDVVNSLGRSPLMDAVSGGYVPVVSVLLSAGANPNVVDKGGETPLLRAAARNDLEAVRLLVKHGADVRACNRRGQRASDLARLPALRRALAAYAKDARLAEHAKEEDRKAAEQAALAAEHKRIKDIEREMGMVEVMQDSRVGTIHVKDAKERFKRLVGVRSVLTNLSADVRASDAIKEIAPPAIGGAQDHGSLPSLA